ncbi:MAG: hypothetical protein OXN89_04005 [Bryobacterales bacterium]|nr:hypothetical protein [Bryobacterales bacterium]
MRYVQAGEHRLIVLDPDQQTLKQVVHQAGYSGRITKEARRVSMEVRPREPDGPLLLFDASDPANLGWFSRCQFFVDSVSGVVLQTPLVVANCIKGSGIDRERLRVSVSTELPAGFRLPGKRGLSEQVVYAMLYNFLHALRSTGVALCGTSGVLPLTGGRRRKLPRPGSRKSAATKATRH